MENAMEADNISILLIDNDHGDQRLFKEMLSKHKAASFDLIWADTLATGIKHLEIGGIDLVLLDKGMCGSRDLETIEEIQYQAPGIPLIVIDDTVDENSAISAVRKGAEDYLRKDRIHTDMLIRILRTSLERKRFRDNRQAGRSRFQRIIVKNADAIIVVNKQGIIRYVNPAAERLFDRAVEELIGTTFGFPMTSGERTEIDIVRKNGKNAVVEMHVVDIEWENENLYLATMRNITERKIAENNLRIYERIVGTSGDLMALIDPRYRLKFVNEAFLKAYGNRPAKIEGQNASELFGRHTFTEEFKPHLDKSFTGVTERSQTWLECPGVGRRFYDIVYAPFHETDGVIAGVLLNCRDITHTKNLEEQLRHAQKMEAIGTLAGGIAHDFNNLLMAIQGRTSLMLSDIAPGHLHYEYLRGIEDVVKGATDLTKQLLGFARGGKYEVLPTNMNELINKTVVMFGRTKKDVEIDTRFEKDLWTVEVDRGQMRQVLLNMFVNAGQAMPEGGWLTITTNNEELGPPNTESFDIHPGRFVKITVTDNGIGMDQATRQRIFDPFFTTKKKERGTGLGLASAYGIMRNHGGFIDVFSESGKGTSFSLYLPSSNKKVPDKDQISERFLSGSETILLVDDEDAIIDVGGQMLEKLGYRVLTANSGREAVEIYRKNQTRIDLVILDMIMAGMGGRETYESLKSLDSEVKVILSSGYSIDGQATEILSRGCKGFIQKPFSLADLSTKIRDIID
jgi:PAS domain S-box-containing protein